MTHLVRARTIFFVTPAALVIKSVLMLNKTIDVILCRCMYTMTGRVRVATITLAIITHVWVLNLILCTSLHNKQSARGKKSYIEPRLLVSGSPSVEAPAVVVVCKAHNSSSNNPAQDAATGQGSLLLRESWTRQLEQLDLMLKTLLYFSKSDKWRIIVMTDTVSTFNEVVKLTHTFPERHRQRLELQHEKVWFPDKYPGIKEHWRPCVWAKQFLAEALPHEDSVVYFDTDVVFLGPAEEVWSLLRSMKTGQVVSLAPEPQYILDNPKRPYAGRAGLNTGVIIANLTRLRQLPGGGLGSAILREGSFYPLPRHDQDALNHFLMNKPHLVQEVTSRWNFAPSSCFSSAPSCPDCVSAGILVLHGADATFYRHIDRKFLVVYHSMRSLRLDGDSQPVLEQLELQLALVDALRSKFPCSNYSNLNHALTLGLKDAATLKVQPLPQH
ncbi:glucoside xylosyltransferase 1-like isoform X2 [Cherax quadricarinatus]|uniref:glucoside xylosyltransferase 1-like isoform X2 n=1 Tax=Cherax quadricarinatus TaxID=27406 RepID=UPI00387E9318